MLPTDVYFGSYTHPLSFVPEARGSGIVACRFDPASGHLEQRQVVGGIINPSYLAMDDSGTHLLAVSEDVDTEGAVWVLRREKSGALSRVSSRPSGGRATCHVHVTAAGIACATSYEDGTLAVYSFKDGIVGPQVEIFRYVGNGANAERQASSHAHHATVSPDLRWLYVCDLGADRIWCHPISEGNVLPALPHSTATPAGSGPRHLCFHRSLSRLYVVCELNAHVLTYDWDPRAGELTFVDEQASLPGHWDGEPSAAAIRIHPYAPALYVSNRIHDSLTVFRLDEAGHPTLASCVPSGGESPRDFDIDPSGAWMLVVNHRSNTVAIHSLDRETGLSNGRPPELFSIPTPTCVLFASRQLEGED